MCVCLYEALSVSCDAGNREERVPGKRAGGTRHADVHGAATEGRGAR